MKFKVCVLGSRSITDYDLIERIINDSGFEISELVSGHCRRGIDYLGEVWAKKHSISIKPFPADWNDLSHPDAVIRINA